MASLGTSAFRTFSGAWFNRIWRNILIIGQEQHHFVHCSPISYTSKSARVGFVDPNGGMMVLKDSKQAEAAFQEIADCRAVNIDVSGFAECLCTGPNSCAYALPFGYAFLCRHPRMGEIVSRTERKKPTLDEAN